MKLQDLEIFVVAPPPPGWGGRYWIFVKLTADNGITGFGEVYATSVGPEAMKAMRPPGFRTSKERIATSPPTVSNTASQSATASVKSCAV